MTPLRRLLLVALTCATGFACIACGTAAPLSAPTSAPSEPLGQGPPEPDWNEPFQGDHLESYGEARASVSFTPIEPKNLGAPVDIIVNTGEKDKRALAFLFDTTPYGRVIVVQRALPFSEAYYVAGNEEFAAGNDRPGRSGSSEIVTVRGSRKALMTTGESRSRWDIRWAENGVELLVEGPRLNREMCITIANGL